MKVNTDQLYGSAVWCQGMPYTLPGFVFWSWHFSCRVISEDRHTLGDRTQRHSLHLIHNSCSASGPISLRVRARITPAFRIPSAQRLRLGLNQKILNVGKATPPTFLNRPSQICSTSGRAKPEIILARTLNQKPPMVTIYHEIPSLHEGFSWYFVGLPHQHQLLSQLQGIDRPEALRARAASPGRPAEKFTAGLGLVPEDALGQRIGFDTMNRP